MQGRGLYIFVEDENVEHQQERNASGCKPNYLFALGCKPKATGLFIPPHS